MTRKTDCFWQENPILLYKKKKRFGQETNFFGQENLLFVNKRYLVWTSKLTFPSWRKNTSFWQEKTPHFDKKKTPRFDKKKHLVLARKTPRCFKRYIFSHFQELYVIFEAIRETSTDYNSCSNMVCLMLSAITLDTIV